MDVYEEVELAALGSRAEARDLRGVLVERLERPVTTDLAHATLALDAGLGDRWTVTIDDGRAVLASGLDPRADTTIVGDAQTLMAVIEGAESGVKAFLDGKVRVRGNLALALRVDGLVEDGDRPPRFPRTRTIDVNGLKTFYLEAGEGPPVVLLHGLGATSASLLPTLWDLARDHRVVVPDLPGHGESDKPIRSYDAPFFAAWLAAFFDAVGIERADVVGNSMGGRIAIELGLVAPERVRRLVLLAPSPAFIRGREFVRVVRFLRPELALMPLPLSRRRVVASLRAMFARPERLSDAWYEAAAGEFLRVFATPRGRIAFLSAARQIYLEEPYGDAGFWDRLKTLSAPALFVWGDGDRLVPARFARHVARALPNAASVVLEDCGHVPQYELPERTHELTRAFLARGHLLPRRRLLGSFLARSGRRETVGVDGKSRG